MMSSRTNQRRAAALLAGLSLALLSMTACSSPAAKLHAAAKAAAQPAATSSAGTVANQPAMKDSDIRMRVINAYNPKGKAGPALDIYDVQLTGQKATPVASDIANGSVSDYFTPQIPANSLGQPAVQLYALPAGADPVKQFDAAKGLGGVIDDNSHAQVTMLLVSDDGGLAEAGPLGRLSVEQTVEAGDDGQGGKGPVAPAISGGGGELLVSTGALQSLNLSLFLMVDNSCAPPTNGDPNEPGLPRIFAAQGTASTFALFPVAAGTHQVSIVNWPSTVTPTCAQLTARQGRMSVTVTAGEQVELFVAGTSAKDLHLIAAPIRQ